MPRRFALAGLLRLRHAQQDQAAAELAAANERLRDAADARMAARRTLDDPQAEVTDAAVLSAVAAARAATRGMLEELAGVEATRRAAADRARSAHHDARRAAIGLEKLEQRHAERVAEEDLRAEQLVLDEIAARTARPTPPETERPAAPTDPTGGAR
ncbi:MULTISPECIES: hypothetical protein [unclassified Curtobacterium]|uniref:hypothetical protein n=1 Tax=unclassified Curtobacterium TaxID=257496 RepID=UPI000DA81C3C|nr:MULTISPECIES: hypothetical protein [unclassified Curtobacterium]PZE29789.1 hypothetical protein DEI86_00355 [Curtobacterium sp. MCBD17_028]PZE75805.1 hypothetical protein DEI82_07865 [Curtobacterium sp. MCBD17_019]PZF60834.1 hypothetical protein DEI92_04095 [Curtobacterium sp. MCBD17_034]PZF66430.1 hypothetical protein DEI81_02165 [Curtobacterium sp. MCBD17_013]PZM40183.1 hypothetical protein DEI90_00330 [Curtobacterium sp. MCBD17_031]